MKKLLLAAAAVCCLAACNKELGPEYKTPPQISEVSYKTTGIAADEVVSVSATFTSVYGLQYGWIAYYLNEDDSDVKQTNPYMYSKNQTSATFTGKIPGQKAGTKVTFQVLATSAYQIPAWTEVYTYTVEDEAEPEPTPDPVLPVEN